MVRLRGVVGKDISGGYKVFGALSFGIVSGEGATDSFSLDGGTSGGLTAGVGVQHLLTNGARIRVEAIVDNFTNAIDGPTCTGGPIIEYAPEYKARSVKASCIMSF